MKNNSRITNNSNHSDSAEIVLDSIGLLTRRDEIILELGKKLFLEANSVARDFCKSMIGISTGAIATYLLILKFVGIENLKDQPTIFLATIIPSLLFLLSALVFVIGYRPTGLNVDLEIIEEIQEAQQHLARRRTHWISIGTILFTIAAMLAILFVALVLSNK
ncbi:MAG: hypothetical protein ACE5OZ_25240 [Candidatus Heimdallarchaeota archaeon]